MFELKLIPSSSAFSACRSIYAFLSVHKELIGLLFCSNKIFTTNNCQVLLVLTLLQSNNFIGLSCFGPKERDFNFSYLLECLNVIHDYSVHLGAQEDIHVSQFEALRSLQVLTDHRHLEIMLILASVYRKAPLIGLVGDAVSNLRSKHHLSTVHVIVHYIF